MTSAPLAALETLLNRCIRESSSARNLLAALDGKSLEVAVRGFAPVLRLEASQTRLSLSAGTAGSAATAAVSGSPLTLLGLVGASTAEGFRASGAELSGDAQTAESFAELLRRARPDIEEELSRIVGDIPAHELARMARRIGGWSRRAGSSLTMNAAEFLQEEARQLPPRAEVDAFHGDVERLRDDVERSAQRLDGLMARTSRRRSPRGRRDAVAGRAD